MHGFFVLILIEKRNKDIDYYVFPWECSVYLFESVSLYLIWKTMILYIININNLILHYYMAFWKKSTIYIKLYKNGWNAHIDRR